MEDGFTHGLISALAQSQEDGTMGILQCCCAEGVNTGDFYGPTQAGGQVGPAELLDPVPEEERADEASRDMLWKVSTKITGGRFPFDGPAYSEPAAVESKLFPEFRGTLPRMDGKVVAITGCTSGTGFVCAKTCVELGARVIMLNRASERADKALLELKKVEGAQVELVPCNLMSFAAVKETAQKLKEELGDYGLDVLCNNAGIMATKDEATVDGCDTQMQTNHLSHFLLTAELWPLLEKAGELRGDARVVNHSSILRVGPPLERKYFERNGGKLGGDEVPEPCTGPRFDRYHQTKLANLVFTYALRDRSVKAGSKVKALVAHPGVASTNLFVTSVQDGGLEHDFTHATISMAAQSQEDGTMGILRCCCAEGVNTGDFYGPLGEPGYVGPADLMEPAPEEERADEASKDMLWKVSTEITGGRFPFDGPTKSELVLGA